MFGMKNARIEFLQRILDFQRERLDNMIIEISTLEAKHEIMIDDVYDFAKELWEAKCIFDNQIYYHCPCLTCKAKVLRNSLLFVSQQEKGGEKNGE